MPTGFKQAVITGAGFAVGVALVSMVTGFVLGGVRR